MKIKFNETEFDKVPEGWDELTFGKWLEIDSIKTEIDNCEDPIEKMYMTYEIYSTLIGCPLEYVTELKSSQMEDLLKEFEWVFQSPNQNIKHKFEIGGQLFYCREDFNDFNNAEMLSIQNVVGNKTSNEYIPLVLAIIIRPAKIENEFGVETIKQMPLDSFKAIKERAQLFKENLTIDDVWGLLRFFFAGVTNSSKTTHTSTEKVSLKIEKTKKP